MLTRRDVREGTGSRRWLKAGAVAVALLAAGLARAQSLTPLAGSPFGFTTSNMQIMKVTGDGQLAFLAYFGGLTAARVNADGSLTELTTVSVPADGVAASDDGARVFVVYGTTVSALSYSNGTLSVLQELQVPVVGSAFNGIEYVELGGRAFVYVNADVWGPNSVARYEVGADGRLTLLGSTPTGADGAGGGYYASPRLVQAAGDRLFALNEYSVAVFDIQPDGGLVAVAGSPFALSYRSSGAIAVAPDGLVLYAGLLNGTLETFTVDPAGALASSGAATVGTAYAGIDGLAVSGDGRYLALTLPNESGMPVRVLDTRTLADVGGSPLTGWAMAPTSVQFNPAGTVLYVSGTGASVSAYALSSFTLTVNVTGGGTVTSSDTDPAIACGGGQTACAGAARGTVTLAAAADATSVFTGWTGCDSVDGAGRCVVAVTAARNVSATFRPAFRLTVELLGTGRGSVSGVAWDTCTATACTGRVLRSSTVTLTATPADSTSLFKGWGVCTPISANACTISMWGDRSASARFEPAFYRLSLALKGAGTGVVTGTAGGLPFTWSACGADPTDRAGRLCTADIANGASVSLTAAAASGSTFKGWGVVCAGTGGCSFRMNGPKGPWATFSSP